MEFRPLRRGPAVLHGPPKGGGPLRAMLQEGAKRGSGEGMRMMSLAGEGRARAHPVWGGQAKGKGMRSSVGSTRRCGPRLLGKLRQVQAAERAAMLEPAPGARMHEDRRKRAATHETVPMARVTHCPTVRQKLPDRTWSAHSLTRRWNWLSEFENGVRLCWRRAGLLVEKFRALYNG